MIANSNILAQRREIVPAVKGQARVSCIGARSFLLEAPGEFDLSAQRWIWGLSQTVIGWTDIAEVIPGMTNLLAIFKETPEDPEFIAGRLLEAWNNAESLDLAGKIIEVPVHYGGAYAIDLPAICDFSGLSDREVVRIHYEADYRVFALGSAPGFAYLHGLDPRIYMPRKTVPSLRMEKGSVTIGGMQTGVAMLTGPNGWNSLGHAELQMFDPTSATPALMAPGDTVRFLPARIEL
ncbi:5-oxoprolinase subunit PxpB [Rhizobium sp. CNPSo 3464]|uniref:5-oxoprolinase subunit PxpB n=1 Tax=Rhizobium sp. CNPSo 3464 TaxID=3021406 RepID=UPI00254D22A3|nr:5-oxoprolinase subunit PxpB [Rhizobium sp. CNPSo 3464]MDK4741602.1 5-oxoprolinase subunit PxpB [Rhizobium sp. CNPSo 3464]